MSLLAGSITHGQAVVLVLLSILLIVFVVADIYLVLFLHRRNKKLAQNTEMIHNDKNFDGTDSTATNDGAEYE